MKADEKMDYGEGEKKEKYTNFEYLCEKVEAMKEQLELIAGILEQNNLVFKSEEKAGVDIEDKTFKRLEE